MTILAHLSQTRMHYLEREHSIYRDEYSSLNAWLAAINLIQKEIIDFVLTETKDCLETVHNTPVGDINPYTTARIITTGSSVIQHMQEGATASDRLLAQRLINKYREIKCYSDSLSSSIDPLVELNEDARAYITGYLLNEIASLHHSIQLLHANQCNDELSIRRELKALNADLESHSTAYLILLSGMCLDNVRSALNHS